MAGSPYRAGRRILWGDGWIEAGDEVPAGEPGRNYSLMMGRGDIVQVPQTAQEREAMAKEQKPDEPRPTAVDAEREAGAKGVVTDNPPVPDEEEAAAGYDDLDHAGEDSPGREGAEAAAERQKAHAEATGVGEAGQQATAERIARAAPKGATETAQGTAAGGEAKQESASGQGLARTRGNDQVDAAATTGARGPAEEAKGSAPVAAPGSAPKGRKG